MSDPVGRQDVGNFHEKRYPFRRVCGNRGNKVEVVMNLVENSMGLMERNPHPLCRVQEKNALFRLDFPVDHRRKGKRLKP